MKLFALIRKFFIFAVVLNILFSARAVASENMLLIGKGGNYSDISEAVVSCDFTSVCTIKFLSDYQFGASEVGQLKDKNIVIDDGVTLTLEDGCVLKCKALYVSGSSNYSLMLQPGAKIIDTKIIKTDNSPQVIVGFDSKGSCCIGEGCLSNVEFCSSDENSQLRGVYAFDSLECKHFNSISDENFKNGILKFKTKESEKEEISDVVQPDGKNRNPDKLPELDVPPEENIGSSDGNSNEFRLSNSNTRVYCEDVFQIEVKTDLCSSYRMTLFYDSELAKMIKVEFFGGAKGDEIVDDTTSEYSEISDKIRKFPDNSIICRFSFIALKDGIFNLQLKNCQIDENKNPVVKYGGAVTILKKPSESGDKSDDNQGDSGGSDDKATSDKDYNNPSSDDKNTSKSGNISKSESDLKDDLDTNSTVKIERFTDLYGYDWCRDAVDLLADNGIIVGTDKDKFSPEQNTKRGDFMLVLSRILNISGNQSDSFLDVPADSYYSGAISALKNLDIAKGSNGFFSPEGFITRQDMFCLIHRVMQHFGLANSSKTRFSLENFSDAGLISPYAVDSIKYLVKNRIVSGDGDMLHPLEHTNRAEIAVICSKLYDMYQSSN